MKKTYRKGFNFFRSYFDVCNELNDKERLKFLDALLNKQFLGIDPTELTGMAKFAWISQIHSIDSQVKGYETKTKTKLVTPTAPPCLAPSYGGKVTPTEQVQVQVQVQEEVQYVLDTFETFWELYEKKGNVKTSRERWIKLKQVDRDKALKVVKDYVISTPDKKFRKGCESWITKEGWNDEIESSSPKLNNREKSLNNGYNHIMEQVRKANES